MAHKTSSVRPARIPPATPLEKEVQISHILKEIGEPENQSLYANHAQFSMTTHEIIIDLFKISPVPGSNPQHVKSEYLQRIFIPHSLGKGFATALANIIDSYERDNNVQVQNNRTPPKEDTIVIWK